MCSLRFAATPWWDSPGLAQQGTQRLSHLVAFPKYVGSELVPPSQDMKRCLLWPNCGLVLLGELVLPGCPGAGGTLVGSGSMWGVVASKEGGLGLRQLMVLSGSTTVTK